MRLFIYSFIYLFIYLTGCFDRPLPSTRPPSGTCNRRKRALNLNTLSVEWHSIWLIGSPRGGNCFTKTGYGAHIIFELEFTILFCRV